MQRLLITRALATAALLCAMAPNGFAAVAVYPSFQDQVPDWVQSPDAQTVIGPGYLGDRFVRLQDGGSIATYLTRSSLANAMYLMTAGVAILSPTSSWTLEVFAGGAPEAGATTPVSSTLLSTEDAPIWAARGTAYSLASQAPVEGTPIWLRVRAVGGALGVDSILGVENVDWSIWFPGDAPSRVRSETDWDFEGDIATASVPEPLTWALVASALLGLMAWRRRAGVAS
jgi:hypothetical protein